jgi:hypothetical protein
MMTIYGIIHQMVWLFLVQPGFLKLWGCLFQLTNWQWWQIVSIRSLSGNICNRLTGYHVLELSLQEVRLFEGNRHTLVEVELNAYTQEINTNETDDELTDSISNEGSVGENLSMHNAAGNKKMEPDYLLKLDSLVSRFEQSKANGKGSDDIKEVATAAVEGRVDTLLIEADRMIAVRITNLVTGNTQKKDLSNLKVDDLLDDMAELVTKMRGQVMVLPTEKRPSETGLAAIFRY